VYVYRDGLPNVIGLGIKAARDKCTKPLPHSFVCSEFNICSCSIGIGIFSISVGIKNGAF